MSVHVAEVVRTEDLVCFLYCPTTATSFGFNSMEHWDQFNVNLTVFGVQNSKDAKWIKLVL